MYIYGIGVDVVTIARIDTIWHQYGQKFVTKILHPLEQDLFALRNPTKQLQFLATRFAAKEAWLKALGTGITTQYSWHSIAILNEPSGKPKIIYPPPTKAALQHLDHHCHLSLSDDRKIGIAFVIIECKEKKYHVNVT